MFSGAKHKLQRWRQRKAPAKIMTSVPSEDYHKKIRAVAEQFQNLKNECYSVIGQLKKQVAALFEIGEDVTVVTDKISLLQDQAKKIEKGYQDSERLTSFSAYVETIHAGIRRCNSEIENLHREASSLCKENRKLRTELQIFQDHHERSELKAVELEVQVEHLKFMNSVPPDYSPFFGSEDENEVKDDEEKYAKKPVVAIPFLEEHSIETAGPMILSILETLDFTDNSRLKILFDLIKSYITNQSYDIAIPLLKTTLEDLTSKYSPHDKIVFKMMEIMVIVYNVTQRLTDAIEVEKEILKVRQQSMDNIGLGHTLSNLALLYGKIGKVKTARVFCRQAFNVKYEVYGDKDLETAKELHNLGVLYSSDRKYPQAIESLRSALNIMQQCPKRSVFCLAGTATNLALAHIQNDEIKQAKALYVSTLKCLNKKLDKMLEGSNISKEELLLEDSRQEELVKCENNNEIIRIARLLVQVKENANTVLHVKECEKKYFLFSNINEE